MSLELVRQGLSNAAMFTADGEVVQPAEVLYKKPILVERGVSSRDKSHTRHARMRAGAVRAGTSRAGEKVVVLMEMTLTNLLRIGHRLQRFSGSH